MRSTTTRRHGAALISGALIAGGLVVAPALAGLGAANAAPVDLAYTCSGSTPLGPISLPGTVTLDVSTPQSVAPGADFDAGITAKLDFGAASMGPVTALTGSFDIPFAVGSDTATFSTPSQTAPATALVYTGAGKVGLTAPGAVGSAPITVGTIVGNFSALGIPITATCLPDAGQDLTVSQLNVAQGDPDPDPDPDPVALPVTGTVKATGAAKVGKTLKAIPGVADGATISYQWLSNGAPIANATSPSLKLTKAMKGKKVSVRATYAKEGYLDTVQTSKAVTVKDKKK